jgi:hypothetical protein
LDTHAPADGAWATVVLAITSVFWMVLIPAAQ